MPSDGQATWRLRRAGDCWTVTWRAMASPCEVLVDCDHESEAARAASLAVSEIDRIERKYSRYRDDSVVQGINRAAGAAIAVDDETARLLRYAARCHELSDGRFDVTSGVLRRAWTFDGSALTPDRARITGLLGRVGWDRVAFDGASVRLEPGMEIDLGGIGKEYAADRVAGLLAPLAVGGVLVNLGGDLRAVAGRRARAPWRIGIEDPGREGGAIGQLELREGGVATSGDARRYCVVDGARLGHILDPRTGWPVAGAPRSVTVIADTCTAAGFLATLAMLHGSEAEAFLDAQQVRYHCVRAPSTSGLTS